MDPGVVALETSKIPRAWRPLVTELLAEYRNALGGTLAAVAVFGSVARGTPGPDSDLDLYLVTRERISVSDPRLDGPRQVRTSQVYEALRRAGYQPDIAPIYHALEDLEKHPWILLDIAHEGIVLYDPSEVLEQELQAIRRRLRELGSQRIERPDGTWYWMLKPDWQPGEIVDL